MEYLENLLENVKYMSQKDWRYVSILVLVLISSLLVILILVGVTNVMNINILVAILILSLSEIGYLLYLNYHENSSADNYTKTKGSNATFPKTLFSTYSEKMGRDIIQETSRQLESTARKNNPERKQASLESSFGIPNAQYHMHSYQNNVSRNKNEPVGRSYENNFPSSMGNSRTTPKFQRGPSEVHDLRPSPTRRGSMTNLRSQTPTMRGRTLNTEQVQQRPYLAQENFNQRFESRSVAHSPLRNEGFSGFRPLRDQLFPSQRNIDFQKPSVPTSQPGFPLTKNLNGADFSFGLYPDKRPDSPINEGLQNSFKKRENEARNTLRRIGLNMTQISRYKDNCMSWFCVRLIPLVWEVNETNIIEINNQLSLLGRSLLEYEYLKNIKSGGPPHMNNPNLVSLEDVIFYIQNQRFSGPIWALGAPMKNETIFKIHQELQILVQKRLYIEKYFTLEGYRNIEIRKFLMERLYTLKTHFFNNFQYITGEILQKVPTDTQIIANLFFKFLSEDTLSNSEKTSPLLRKKIVFDDRDNLLFYDPKDEDVYFKQSNPEGNEPHYDILSGRELWSVLPGRDNLFYAVALFLYHVKIKNNSVYGSDPHKELKSLLTQATTSTINSQIINRPTTSVMLTIV